MLTASDFIGNGRVPIIEGQQASEIPPRYPGRGAG